MIDFRNLPITFAIPWPVLVLMGIGVLAIVVSLGFGAWWLFSHLQWVP
jgi:hypothetical protein